MTFTVQNKAMQLPDFYIYTQGQDGILVPVGRAYNHNKGTGFNILVDGKRYVAFQPKAKTPALETTA